MSKVLVLGANGQVGYHLRRLLPESMCWDRAALDFADSSRVESAVLDLAPTFIINAAAFTAVDRAESDAATAWAVNAEAPAALARAAHQLSIPLVHLSTDYVFNGDLDRPYRESDPVSPINVYGRTKLAGELAVSSLCNRYWILRTSWVFSEHGGNFVKTMLRLAGERDTLSVVDDQYGSPTYAEDIARIVSRLVSGAGSRVPWGLYHIAGGTETTWRRFADAIFCKARQLGSIAQVPVVRGIPTAEYPTPARRPLNSRLAANSDLIAAIGFKPDWEAGLDMVLRKLRAAPNL